MRILVIGQDNHEKKQLLQTLQGGGRTVRIVSDERSALPALQQAGAQLAIVTTDVASDAALACIRLLHENSRSTKPYLLLVCPNLPEDFLSAAYDAGIDGHLSSPYGAPYLLARIDAVHRRLSPNDYKPRANGAAERGAPASSSHSPVDQVVLAAPWRNAPGDFAALASKFLTLGVSAVPLPSNSVPLGIACAIHLASSKLEAEVRIAVGADMASASALAVHLFGPGSEDLAGDMVGELANNFMGTLKSGLSALALPFTGGLPENLATECVLRPHNTYQAQQAFQLELADARLVVHIGLRSKGNLFVTPDALKEGMVLAKDVFNQKGLLLVNHGTRLSANMIGRLRDVLAAKQAVEVMTT